MKDRLEFWSTLPKEELKRRVQAELSRTDLSFAETQLLDAAQERLRAWREPSSNSRETKMNNEKPADPGSTPAAAPASAPTVKEPAVRKAKGNSGGAKKVVTKKAKLTKSAKTAKSAKTTKKISKPRLDPEAKVVKTNKENPFREGSEAAKRVDIVLKSSGQTVGTIQKKPGLKSSTLTTMKRLGLIKIEA